MPSRTEIFELSDSVYEISYTVQYPDQEGFPGKLSIDIVVPLGEDRMPESYLREKWIPRHKEEVWEQILADKRGS